MRKTNYRKRRVYGKLPFSLSFFAKKENSKNHSTGTGMNDEI